MGNSPIWINASAAWPTRSRLATAAYGHSNPDYSRILDVSRHRSYLELAYRLAGIAGRFGLGQAVAQHGLIVDKMTTIEQ
jgi:hypothetical protein